MIAHYDLVQGSEAWQTIRLGIVTCSRLDCLVTPAKLEPSKSAAPYRNELLAEWFLREPARGFSSGFMERGSDMEARARAAYEWEVWDNEINVRRVGFVWADNELWGGSPDGFVRDDGILEIKTPSAPNHIANVLGGMDKYRLQVQGLLLLTGRQWCDLVSWNPSLPSIRVRAERDDEVIDKLREAIGCFIGELLEHRTKLAEKGFKRVTPQLPQPTTDREFTDQEQDWWASRGHAVAGQA